MVESIMDKNGIRVMDRNSFYANVFHICIKRKYYIAYCKYGGSVTGAIKQPQMNYNRVYTPLDECNL